MSSTVPPPSNSELVPGGTEPVLALLAEISASLKELNSTLKNHTIRLGRLEGQKPGYEAAPHDKNVEATRSEGEEVSVVEMREGTPVRSHEPGYKDVEARNLSNEVSKPIELISGTILPHELFDQLDFYREGTFNLGYNKEFMSWLTERKLPFAYDGRRSLPFDVLNLCYESGLHTAQEKFKYVEEVFQDLRNSGGSFFILEHWDGSQNRGWTRYHDFMFSPPLGANVRVMRRDSVEPSTLYQMKGDRSRDIVDWQVIAPFRRLCVFFGVFRMPNIAVRFPGWYSRAQSLETGGGFDDLLRKYIELEQFKERFVMPSPVAFSGRVAPVPKTNFSLIFQFAWYEIIGTSDFEFGRPSGKLYRDSSGRNLQKQSCLVAAFWNRSDMDDDSDDWTIILMLPASFHDTSSTENDVWSIAILKKPVKSVLQELTMMLFEIISRSLHDWTAISDYVEKFLGTKFSFLDEEQHDGLLFDDDTFSRSRQYSWVITSIGEFIPIIQKMSEQYQEVMCWIIEPRTDTAEKKEDRLKGQKYQEQLVSLEARFQDQKIRAEALRDGLFNASAVVESRLSTRLAQNVKLLTYVSIFYLPLAFCAALWAIPNITESTTRTPFIIAAILIAFVTYMVVFNLNALAAFGWATYKGFRRKCIQNMTQQEKWEELGVRFNRFEPDRGSDKPSEWYILLYCIVHPFRLYEHSSNSTTTSKKDAKKDKKTTREDRKGKDKEGNIAGTDPHQLV